MKKMVHHYRTHVQRKGQEGYDSTTSHNIGSVECGEQGNTNKKYSRRRLLRLFLLFSFISCLLLLSPKIFRVPFFSSFFSSYIDEEFKFQETNPCPDYLSNGTICCDRRGFRTEVCYMMGDIRTIPSTKSIFLFSDSDNSSNQLDEIVKIRPYTRKWEPDLMKTIDELTLSKAYKSDADDWLQCDVHHTVPIVIFSTGGFTGNVYHEFNDGIIPLYITSQHYEKEVIFGIWEYHEWWVMRYENIVSLLSNYRPMNLAKLHNSHCFPEVVAGLNIHDELTINSSLMTKSPKSIVDFRNLLDTAYGGRIRYLQEEKKTLEKDESNFRLISNPRLVIISRNNSRAILNQDRVVQMAEEIGFKVDVLSPTPETELAKIYWALNSSDVMMGVHGAAMTHLLFMRPGTVFIQIVPLGTDWAAQTYYGDPAIKLGLKYMSYKILPRESSLYEEYDKDDPVLTDPSLITDKGWEVTKRVYLDGQNVKLDLRRFRKRLVKAHIYSVSKRTSERTGQSSPLQG